MLEHSKNLGDNKASVYCKGGEDLFTHQSLRAKGKSMDEDIRGLEFGFNKKRYMKRNLPLYLVLWVLLTALFLWILSISGHFTLPRVIISCLAWLGVVFLGLANKVKINEQATVYVDAQYAHYMHLTADSLSGLFRLGVGRDVEVYHMEKIYACTSTRQGLMLQGKGEKITYKRKGAQLRQEIFVMVIPYYLGEPELIQEALRVAEGDLRS